MFEMGCACENDCKEWCMNYCKSCESVNNFGKDNKKGCIDDRGH